MAKKPEVQEKESAFSDIIKKFKQNPGIYIGSVVILILVTVTFIGGDFISGGGLSGRGDDYIFGYYEKEPINYVPGNYFALNYENISRYYQSQGVDVNDFRISSQLWRYAYEAAVAHTAIMQIMKKSNYSVPDNIVDREVAKLDMFQENGRFSRELYRQISESTRLSIWRQKREELGKMMYFSDYASLKKSKGEINFIAGLSMPSRSFDMVSFIIDDYPNEEYLAYAMENSNLFNSIHLSKITINSSEREAKRILQSIKDGTVTFEDAARNHSQDNYADMGGDMGNRFFNELDSEIPVPADRDLIFTLRRGEISDIIQTSGSWSFFRVENEVLRPDFEDDTVMERVRSHVRNFQRGRMEDWAISQANEFILEAQDFGFDSAADRRYLERSSFGPLPLNFGSVDLFTSLDSFSISGLSAQDISSLARNENFWKTVFSAQLNAPSQPLVHGNNVFVFHLTDEIESDESSVETVKTTYESWWLNYISEQLLQQYFINSPNTDDQFWDAYFRYLM